MKKNFNTSFFVPENVVDNDQLEANLLESKMILLKVVSKMNKIEPVLPIDKKGLEWCEDVAKQLGVKFNIKEEDLENNATININGIPTHVTKGKRIITETLPV